jgi:hypothetical protein
MKSDRRQLELPYQAHSPTSAAAAEAAAPTAPTDRARILDLLQRAAPDGFTDEQIARMLRLNPSTARPRRIELTDAHLVHNSGRTHLTRAKRRAVVWVAAKKG